MATNWPAKDPDEVYDYVWKPALDTGDTIASHTIVPSGDNTTIIDSSSNDNSSVLAVISGGTVGMQDSFTVRAVTAGARTIEETIYLSIESSANTDIALLKKKYPAFAAVDDETLLIWIDDAKTSVDDRWSATDYLPAILALAAHNMTLIGIGKGALPVGVTKFKSASFEATVSDAIAGDKGFGSTVYGREFRKLLRRNHSGPRLVKHA